MKDYATYENKTNKIAKAGKILAFSGFVVGGTTLALNDELKPELKLLLGIPAGASFMTGLLLISIAQARYQKMMRDNVSNIHKIVSDLNQQVKTKEQLMSKKHIKLLDKPANFWVKVHIIGYLILFSSLGTYLGVNHIAFNKKQKEKPKAILENSMVAQKIAKNALTAQAALGATLIFGGLAMWRKKEKQYE